MGKQIKNLVEVFTKKVYSENMLTKNDLNAISELMDQKVAPIVKEMRSGFKQLRKADKEILSFLDKQDCELGKRVDRVEKQLRLSSFS